MVNYRKIGVWNTAFLGDALLTLPLIKALNNAFPLAEVHFFVRAGLEALFQGQPGIASATGFDKRGKDKSLKAARNLGKKISSQNFDLWICPHRSFRSSLVSHASNIPTRIGYDSPWFNRLSHTQTVSRKFNELAEIERLMQLLVPIGIDTLAPWPKLKTVPLSSAFPDKPLLGVHPGSTWPTKKWPLKYFGEIVRQAVARGAQVVVFGGPGEEPDARELIQLSGCKGSSSITDLSGSLDLPALAAHIAAMNIYLTNDSGPMHLAWMLNIPTVALFGPTVKELGFFPRGNSTVLEVNTLDCRPCGLHGPKKCPKGHFHCMIKLEPDTVWKAIEKHLLRATPLQD